MPFFQIDPNTTVKELKKQIQRVKSHLYPDRQELRLEPRSKGLGESQTAKEVGLKDQGKLYLKVKYKFYNNITRNSLGFCLFRTLGLKLDTKLSF